MKRSLILVGGLSALGLCCGPAPVSAQTTGDLTPLGRSASAGAVCRAVRDYDEPLAQGRGARAWAVRCLGWDASVGRLYQLPNPEAVAIWRKGLSARATCQAPQPMTLAGLTAVERSVCRRVEGKAPYLTVVGRRGRATFVAEGYPQVADVLETGMRVASGAARAPQAGEALESRASAEVAADFGGSLGGLSSAVNAAAADPGRLLARGYVRNNEWRFDQAETDFRSLVSTMRGQNTPPAQLGEAMLNLALNVSNSGRFAEADALFDQADAVIARAANPILPGQALNYRALHLRNQGRFVEAVTFGRQALAARDQARVVLGVRATAPAVTEKAGQVVIDPDLAQALNLRSGSTDLIGSGAVSPRTRLLIQDAEALEVIGSSQLAAGDAVAAGRSLAPALTRLDIAQADGALSVRLRARVQADQGDLALAAGRPAQAVGAYELALTTLRVRHAGSSTEAGLLLDKGRAEVAAGRTEAALASFGRAFALFKSARGSLGGSADAAQPYFDLLIALAAKDPAKAADYNARFFAAAETVVSDATASTVSRLAARVASGDDATAGLVRALDDTRRQIGIAESRVAGLQAQNAYTGEAKTRADGELQGLQAQLATLNGELLAVNPRYNQLVASDASLAALQKALRPDEVYVKTLLLGPRGYGLLVSSGSVRAYPIDLTREEAARQVKLLRAPFEAENTLPRFDVAVSAGLFDRVFGPVREPLLAAKHLIYEPDAALVSVPAAVFVTDQASVALRKGRRGLAGLDYRGVAWLGEKVDSSLVLSAASFLQSRAFSPSRAKQSFLGFGDPALARTDPRAYASVLRRSGADLLKGGQVCGATRAALLRLPSLPDTVGEIRSVAGSLGAPADDLVLGQAFTDGAVRGRRDLSDYRVVYFATHALLPMPDACLPEPALVTSVGDANSDGLLDASEIVDLKLDADLVVLSACDTGGAGAATSAGTGLEGGGEALGGLTRAVIYAGARGLVVSHWSVDSAATVQLMTDFFRSGAATEAEGLQMAQAKMQQQARFSHPYYWAPFTLVGDGARPIPGSQTRPLQAAAK